MNYPARYVAEHSRANIMVVEDEEQLAKVCSIKLLVGRWRVFGSREESEVDGCLVFLQLLFDLKFLAPIFYNPTWYLPI